MLPAVTDHAAADTSIVVASVAVVAASAENVTGVDAPTCGFPLPNAYSQNVAVHISVAGPGKTLMLSFVTMPEACACHFHMDTRWHMGCVPTTPGTLKFP